MGICERCGHQYDDDASIKYCSVCGKSLLPKRKESKLGILIAVLIVLSLFAAVVIGAAIIAIENENQRTAGMPASMKQSNIPTMAEVVVPQPSLNLTYYVSYKNPYPQINVTKFKTNEGWNFSYGYYTNCDYTIENTGDADGYADIIISGNYKGELVRKTELIRAGSSVVNSAVANTCESDTRVYLNCTNVTKVGNYYDGYHANVDYMITNPATKDRVATVVIVGSNGKRMYESRLFIPANDYVSETKKINLNGSDRISYVSLEDVKFV